MKVPRIPDDALEYGEGNLMTTTQMMRWGVLAGKACDKSRELGGGEGWVTLHWTAAYETKLQEPMLT